MVVTGDLQCLVKTAKPAGKPGAISVVGREAVRVPRASEEPSIPINLCCQKEIWRDRNAKFWRFTGNYELRSVESRDVSHWRRRHVIFSTAVKNA